MKLTTLTENNNPFSQAIRENPADWGIKLQYADWLEDRGDPLGHILKLTDHIAYGLPKPPRIRDYTKILGEKGKEVTDEVEAFENMYVQAAQEFINQIEPFNQYLQQTQANERITEIDQYLDHGKPKFDNHLFERYRSLVENQLIAKDYLNGRSRILGPMIGIILPHRHLNNLNRILREAGLTDLLDYYNQQVAKFRKIVGMRPISK